ncbi:MAG TPA: hypothetical protein VMM78_17720 [Thermomicrobiales bacterium]|nr:hypothetical protein [Thermomicrobiales bacterium]
MFTTVLRSIIVCSVLILGSAGYVFASSNTAGPSSGGDGSGAISGYSIANVSYTLNAASPNLLDSVSFNITGASAPATVMVRLVTASSTWHACAAAPVAPRFTCDTTDPRIAVAEIDELRVVSAQ